MEISTSHSTSNMPGNLRPHLSLFDLVCIGVGGTVGSGVFVVSSLVASSYSGPSAPFSWLVAGFSCLLSAGSYAELSRVHAKSSGSTYEYTKILGEYVSVIAAWCLTLEYGVSAAAVSRSWGDKLSIALANHFDASTSTSNSFTSSTLPSILSPGSNLSIFGFLLQVSCTLLLMAGADVGRVTTNAFTVIKVLLVIFIILAGLSLFQVENVTPNVLPFGFTGLLKGAGPSFFGYVGFDEVCSFSAEASDPKSISYAIFITVILVTLLYSISALALVGMQPYSQINPDAGFSAAFAYNGWQTAQYIVIVGELVTLPVVTLVSFLAQPRLFYQLSTDGHMPKIFSKVNSQGNLVQSIVITGVALSALALFVPFTYLDDFISAGILLSFCLTNASLIVFRRGNCRKILVIFFVSSLIGSLCASGAANTSQSQQPTRKILLILTSAVSFLISLCAAMYIHVKYPEISNTLSSEGPVNGGTINSHIPDALFRVPLVPWIPLSASLINCLLISNLSTSGLLLLTLYLMLATVIYIYRYISKHGLQHFIGQIRRCAVMPFAVSDRLTGKRQKEKDGGIEYTICRQGEAEGG